MVFTAEKITFPISNGLLEKKHYSHIGTAIWEFLWLIDKITEEYTENGERWGKVLGGKAISGEDIANVYGSSTDTIKRNLKKLEENGYIRTKRLPRGKAIDVRRSIKWHMRFHDASIIGNKEGMSASSLDHLVKIYRQIPGVIAKNRDSGAMGKFRKIYSEKTILDSLSKLKDAMQKRRIENPLGYLSGILEKGNINILRKTSLKNPDCPNCGGQGYHLVEVPMADSINTKTMHVECKLCNSK